MKEVYEFLKKAVVFYIATMDGDKPRVRPFGALNIYEDRLYLQTGKIKDVSKQISVNPNVEICAFKDGTWIRIEATLVEDNSYNAKKSMLDANPELKAMYSAEDENTEVLYFTNAKATFYSFTSAPKVVEF